MHRFPMQVLMFALVFAGLALVAAVPLVALLHVSEHHGLNDR
ncbi:hypothetical protein Amir_0048 [Actinosynnema mirum DSM 43827]|uniref:Uncharacterized protein n=1 Tax=Actinosynnema mirum (strain ATCC 29888 / DSM 43827 / JCM 3225 / NBRC 14064 / NCIMB 13271 / NRRL B-12336 / IMRU 3971 / 101) TaxID=446462 RepID=C6WCK1_ACTMD|nr:hypothetical protein Amir_0048 [Actinosynnema mirum DSM 43827]AXX27415.1 hypothetical protein APASM_0050 [Actinosynnema pretiosum subsp. pretiosum]